MARSFAINQNNDIHALNGRLQISVGLQAVLETCERVVKASLGEMIYATDLGTSYFNSVWGASPNVLAFEASARTQLSRVANVIAVEEFTAEIRNNSMVYSATIRTTFGTDTING